jgi:hypothetical protein
MLILCTPQASLIRAFATSLTKPIPTILVIVSPWGELDILFRTGNDGSPNLGVLLTDPRGRRIGFDPFIKQAWQALPVAQGDISCDLGRTNTCRGIVQVCGPISGTYKLEITALKTIAYSLSVLGRSKEVLDDNSLQSHFSKTDLNNLAIRRRSREIVLLHYSRDPQGT